jgi:hypothetical protein
MMLRQWVAVFAVLLLSAGACGSHTSVVTTPDAATLAALQAGKVKIKFVRIVPASPVAK